MDRDALIQTLQSVSAPVFLEEHLFDRVPHVFAGDRAAYVTWKRALGNAIDVDPACLTIVGSAVCRMQHEPCKEPQAL